MKRFAVVLDDPQMSRGYGFVIEAEDEGEAALAAVRRAILCDPLGCGAGGKPVDAETRRVQAGDDVLVPAMAEAYVQVAPLFELPERIVVAGGADEAVTRRALDEYAVGFELRKPDDDPHDWIATWPGGHETRVAVP